MLYLRVRDAAEKRRSRILELSPKDTGLTPVRVAVRALRAGPAGRRRAGRRWPTPTSPSSCAAGTVVVIVGRANLAEPERLDAPGAGRGAGRRARRQGPAGAAAGQRARRARRPGCCRARVASTRPASSRPRPAGASRCLVLLGADPLSDFPDAGLARRALDGAGAVIAVDTHLTASSAAGRRACCPAAAFAEKAGTTTNLEGRVTTLSARRSPPPGTAQPGLDHRRRPGRCARHRPRRRLGRASCTTSWSPPCRAFAPAIVGRAGRDARRRAPGLARDRQPSTGRARRPAAGDPQLLRPPSRGEPHALRRRRRAWPRRRRWPRWRRGGRLHVHPLDLDRLGATTGTALKVSSGRDHAACWRSRPTPACRTGHGLAALQPAGLRGRRADRLDRTASSTSAWRT